MWLLVPQNEIIFASHILDNPHYDANELKESDAVIQIAKHQSTFTKVV
jgi:hypothetical protein